MAYKFHGEQVSIWKLCGRVDHWYLEIPETPRRQQLQTINLDFNEIIETEKVPRIK